MNNNIENTNYRLLFLIKLLSEKKKTYDDSVSLYIAKYNEAQGKCGNKERFKAIAQHKKPSAKADNLHICRRECCVMTVQRLIRLMGESPH